MTRAALLLGLLTAAPVTLAQAAPCIDLYNKPATVVSASGFVGKAEHLVGAGSSVNATADQNICPLTAGQKAHVWLRKSYSPINAVAAAFDAAIWQATEPRSEGGYGQGWDAYGSRFGAALANTESSRFFGSFLYPTLFREDPRYFREARGGAGHRLGYALSRVVVTRTDRGRRSFNFSQVLGAFTAAALTNAYYPEADQNVPRTMRAAGFNLLGAAGWNVVYEFGPDLLRKIGGHKKSAD